MRAAAILGPGNVAKSLATFQRLTGAEWTSLIEQADVAVIFGGDGTVHRHLAELVELDVPLLIVPCGSGNDFARALKIRNVRDAVEAWKSFAASGNTRAIDLGVISPFPYPQGLRPQHQGQRVPTAEVVALSVDSHSRVSSAAEGVPFRRGPGTRTQTETVVEVLPFPSADIANEAVLSESAEASAPQPHYFCCVAGVGIDTEIARRANALPKWIRARGGYALSAPRQLIRFAPFPMKISRNGANNSSFQPTILSSVANAPAYGGGMKIAPNAKLDDGKLDVCVVRGMNPFKLFCLFPTVYFGRHLGFEEIEYEQTDCVRVETEIPLDVYADGEYVCKTPVEFSVARNTLKVITPE
jgi:diacylglycerol kinase family enzyme